MLRFEFALALPTVATTLLQKAGVSAAVALAAAFLDTLDTSHLKLQNVVARYHTAGFAQGECRTLQKVKLHNAPKTCVFGPGKTQEQVAVEG